MIVWMAAAFARDFEVEPSREFPGTGDQFFGVAVAPLGDTDGDGFGEIVIAGTTAPTVAGLTVLEGTTGGMDRTRQAAYFGAQSGGCCTSAAAADIDGDGFVDLFTGDTDWEYMDPVSGVVVVLGGPTGFSGVADHVLVEPSPSDQTSLFGSVVAGLPDVDGDGDDELLVAADVWYGAARGTVYLWRGDPGGPAATPDTSVRAPDADPSFGFDVAALGDADGDGVDDFVVGNPDETARREGRAYVFGGAAEPTLLATLEVPGSSWAAGQTVAGAGDVDGDGYRDILVDDPRTCSLDQDVARFFVFFGGEVIDPSTWQMQGCPDATCGAFGVSLDGVGDVDGDGYGEVLVGDTDPAAPGAWLFAGTAAGLDLAAPMNLTVTAPPTYYGYVVGAAGDVDGDALPDVVLADPVGPGLVQVWVHGDGVVDTGWTDTGDTGADPDDTGTVDTDTDEHTGPGTIDTAGEEPGEDDKDPAQEGCGCATGTTPGWGLVLGGGLALRRRRAA